VTGNVFIDNHATYGGIEISTDVVGARQASAPCARPPRTYEQVARLCATGGGGACTRAAWARRDAARRARGRL
jgi:hypothetical protein